MSTSSSSSSSAVPAWVADLPSHSTDLTPLSQSLLTPQLASAFRIPPEPFRTLLDVHSASLQTLSTLKSPIKDPITDPIMDPKRTRLVWTPQLHKRFVDVVGHLGVKSAVPKTIMQMMNVEGLTRENVASHLQKYRLYLKTVHGFDDAFDDDDDGVSENQEANSRFNDNHKLITKDY